MQGYDIHADNHTVSLDPTTLNPYCNKHITALIVFFIGGMKSSSDQFVVTQYLVVYLVKCLCHRSNEEMFTFLDLWLFEHRWFQSELILVFKVHTILSFDCRVQYLKRHAGKIL